MKIINNYIAKQVIIMIAVVAVALLGLDFFFNLVHELKVVGKGQYTLGRILAYLGLTMPSRLYTMFPWAALIGTLISLGALANHSELVVMRTSGISILKITKSVLRAALFLIVVVMILGEVVAPVTERLAHSKKTLYLSGGQSIQTAYGLWVKQEREFIHIQMVRSNGELLGVTRYLFDDDRRLKEAFFAKSATPVGKEWQLNQISGTRFLGNKTSVFQEESTRVPYLLDAEVLETAMIKHPERLSFPALWRAIEYRVKNKLNTQNYELAFWTKAFQPLVILMMIFLAVPFVFGPLRSKSMGSKVVVGILTAFSFHTLNHLFSPLAIVYQLPPLLAVLLPIILFSGVGIWLLRRIR
jgi:lipopolysaccharide export system permease protein